MPTTALIAGGLGAAGSIGSALIGSNASQQASAQQVAMQQQALAQQQSLYNQGLSTAQGALNPFISAGQGAAGQLTNLLTPGTSAASLAQMPGYQFAQQYGTMAATNALSAKSGASAGPLATAISQYNNGLASQQYQNVVGNLQNLTNTGAGAAGTLGTAALGGAINEGNSQASTLGNIGNAQAAGTLGSANALSSGLTGATGGISNALLLGAIGGNGLGGANGLYGGIKSALANNGLSNGVSNGGFNYLDAQAA